MGDVTRALSGLGGFEVTGAVECAAGGLEVSVRLARPDAACPRCGAFSIRVKEYRTQRVRDGLSYERPTTLVWTKRRFRCATPGCVGSFTESSGQVGPRRRVTARLCYANTDRQAAEAAPADWRRHADAFDVAETNRLARTLRAWQPELLAYFDGRLTNGPTEGANRIIKAAERRGFGYTNPENYRRRVLYRYA